MACGTMQQSAILVWVILLQPCTSYATTAGTQGDAEILLQFKSAVCKGCETGLEDWNSQNISNMCTWHGVTCHPKHHGRVSALELEEHDLSGALPASLWNLSYLTTLDLYYNKELTGNIPSEIGYLRRLTYLDLDYCNFTGTFPSSIWNLTALIDLHLSANSFDISIPDEISNLQQLEALNLAGRWVTHSVSRSQIRGRIPESLGNCTKLQMIDLGWNLLTETVPAAIWQSLYNLEAIGLSYNSFSCSLAYMLAALSNCTKLSILDLGNNMLSGTIPVDWQRLPHLAVLDLPHNDFTGSFPPNIPAAWSNLMRLTLQGNRLSGNLPAYLGSLPKLIFLRLNSNNFHGRIPSSFRRISQVNTRQRQNNFIYFDVSSNNLTGPLPSGLSAKYYFNVSFNYLEGEVFLSIFSSSANYIIDLSYNQFDKINPLQIHNSSMESYIDVSNNRLVAGDMQYFCLLPGLALLDASSNRMTGGLPMCLFNMPKLQVLVIFNNSFSSPFPNITNLQGFRNNVLDDFLVSPEFEIPGTPFSIIFTLVLQFRIRTKGVKRTYQSYTNAYVNLTLLDISLNNFSGPIPSALASLNLRYLNLSFNKFDGLVPEGLAKISVLESLDLSNNQLTGSVSPLFCPLGLSIFNLSQNQLEGEVPNFCCTKYDKTSFLHNPDLCGCPPLKPCKAPSPDQHFVAALSGESFLDNVSIPASIIGFFIGFFPTLYICYKGRKWAWLPVRNFPLKLLKSDMIK